MRDEFFCENLLIKNVSYADVISSLFSTPARAMVGVRLHDAEPSGNIRINAGVVDSHDVININAKKRRSAARSSRRSASRPRSRSRSRRSRSRRSASRRSRSRRSRSRRSRSRRSRKGRKSASRRKSPRAASAKRKNQMEFCVQDEASMGNPDPAVRAAFLQRARQLGATHLRQMIYMQALHPCRKEEADAALAKYETLVREAQASGLEVQLVLTGVAAQWGIPRHENVACAKAPGNQYCCVGFFVLLFFFCGYMGHTCVIFSSSVTCLTSLFAIIFFVPDANEFQESNRACLATASS